MRKIRSARCYHDSIYRQQDFGLVVDDTDQYRIASEIEALMPIFEQFYAS